MTDPSNATSNNESTAAPSQSIPSLTIEQLTVQRDVALGQIRFARQYTLNLLEHIEPELWNLTPEGAPSNLIWQVGHLAVSQYGLMLYRQRGREPEDLELVPGWFRKRFGRGSDPREAANTPTSAQEMLEILHRIDQKAHEQVAQLPIEGFGEATEMPYAVYPMRIGALLFCPLHESIHAGQIGLIRRLLGKPPVR